MGWCSWPLALVAWCISIVSSKRYEDESEEPPAPRFRDLAPLKQRFTRTYDLRPTKDVCYTESDTDAGFD
jgi:hypothetical protein